MNRLRSILVMFALTPSFSWAKDLPPKMNLREVVYYTIEKAPSLEIVRREAGISELTKKNAMAAFLPSLDLSSTHGLSETNPSNKNYNNVSQFGLSLTQTLYDNGRSLTLYSTASLQNQIAQLNYENERDRLTLEVGLAFMDYSLKKSLYDVQETQFKILDKQYKTVSSQYQQGVRTRRDYLRFKTELRRSEIELYNSRTAIMRSQVELLRLMGLEQIGEAPATEFITEEIRRDNAKNLPTQAPDPQKHFLYSMAKLQAQVYGNDVTLAWRRYWPEVGITAGADYKTSDYWHSGETWRENDATSWKALLTLKFNLWDGGTRNRDVDIAKNQRVQREKELESKLNTFTADNQRLMLDLAQGKRNYDLGVELLEMESSSYTFIENEYRNGRSTYLELIVGLRDLLSAKVKMYSSYYDLMGLLMRYRYHEGRLYESINTF